MKKYFLKGIGSKINLLFLAGLSCSSLAFGETPNIDPNCTLTWSYDTKVACYRIDTKAEMSSWSFCNEDVQHERYCAGKINSLIVMCHGGPAGPRSEKRFITCL